MQHIEEVDGLPPRWPQAILAVIVVGVFLAAQLLSDRPQIPLNRPWIDHVAELPATANKARYTEWVYSSTASLQTGRRLTATMASKLIADQARATFDPDKPASLGYSIKEGVALAMPFFAYKDLGYTLYVDNGGQRMYFAPLDDDGMKLLRGELKTDIGADYTFRWWNHMWGWIPLLALIGVIALELRRARIKRDRSGMM